MPKRTEGIHDHYGEAAAALSVATPVADRLHLLAAQMTDEVVTLRAALTRAVDALNAIRAGGGER